MTIHFSFVLLVLLTYIGLLTSIHVPGVSMQQFERGEKIDVKAIKLSSRKTQLPYDYYSLAFCEPEKKIVYQPENLGEILVGDRLVNTPFEIRMALDESCKILCSKQVSDAEWVEFNEFIKMDYRVNLLIDNLPAVVEMHSNNEKYYENGFKVGQVFSDGTLALNNHINFKLKFHQTGKSSFRFVGFEIIPQSIGNDGHGIDNKCANVKDQKALTSNKHPIAFSYSVTWEASDITWGSRWDIYLKKNTSQIHWLSIMNSILVIFLLTGLLAMILIRILRRDISQYNKIDDVEDILEESGWKLVHGDVFRPPRFGKLFTAMIGSGIQLFCMVSIILFFATLGAISPASRGSCITAAIFSYNFTGMIAGFFAGRLYIGIKGKFWKSTAIITGVLYPAFVFLMGLFMNCFLWGVGSSSAVPFSTIFAMLSLWCLVSIPLVYLGFFFGYRRKPDENPVRTNQIPRAVPLQKWTQNIFFVSLVGGAMPFGALSVELFFLLSAIWNRQIFYLFGFLFVVFIIFTICCGQVSMFLIYFQLCNENYNWWWRSICIPGGTAIYVFIYTIYYFHTQLSIHGAIPSVIYFGYSTIISSTIFLLSGTIGFYSCYFFIKKIYSSIKVD